MPKSSGDEQIVVSVKFPSGINSIIDDICEKRGEDKSSFVRRSTLKELARLGYLDEDTKKALGI